MAPLTLIRNEIAEKASSRLDVTFSALVVLLPILQQYAGVGQIVSLGELLLIPYMGLYLIKDCRILGSGIDGYLFVFYLLSLGLSVIGGFPFEFFSFSEFWTLTIRLVFYAILILVARRHFSWSSVRGFYLSLTMIAAFYLLLQYVFHVVTGGYLPIVLSDDLVFAPERTFDTWTDKYQWFFRPSSFFLEPSYYSLFTLPALAIFALDDQDGSPLKFGLLTLTYALSMANSGIIASLVVLFALVIFKRKTHSDYLIALCLLAVAVVYLPFNNVDWLTAALERFFSGGTLNNRLFRGLISFGLLDPWHQLVGVGLNNLGSFLEYYGLATGFDEDGLNYCASWLQTLNYSGIIGFVSLCVYAFHLHRLCEGKVARVLFWVLAVVMAYESVLFSYRFAFLLILLEGLFSCTRDRARGGVTS